MPMANKAVRVDITCLAALPPLALDTESYICSAWMSVNPISAKERRDSSVTILLQRGAASWLCCGVDGRVLLDEHNDLQLMHSGCKGQLQSLSGLYTEEVALLTVHRRTYGTDTISQC